MKERTFQSYWIKK